MSLLSYSVIPDAPQQKIYFSLTFDRVPDFATYDSVGRQADGFWIDILNSPAPSNILNGFGGEDIRIMSSWFPFWGGTSSDFSGYFATATPRNSGTQFIEKFPFQETGATVSFTTTFSQLHETDGVFEAILLTVQYGASQVPGTHISPVPEPSTTFLFGVCALALATWRSRSRRNENEV
jgi:hypothetical protein